MFFLLACSQPSPIQDPSNTEETTVQAEAPAPEGTIQPSPLPEPSAPDELIIPLEPTPYCDGGSHAPLTKDIFATGPQHPNADWIEFYFGPRTGKGNLMVGLEQNGQIWSVSADIDENGIIQDNERFTMLSQTPTSDGQFHVAEFSYPYPTQEDPSYQLAITLTLIDKPDGLVMETCVESGRMGEIPVADGVTLLVVGVGGDFSQPGTSLIVDGNRDGTPDSSNYLNHYTIKEGLVQLPDGNVYTTQVDAAGTFLRLRPTDAPLTGLHFLTPAPNFEGKATDGQNHTLSDYAGKVLLLDFWATWCAPCIALHPEVEEFAEAHSLTVLGISADDTNQELKRWLKKNPIPWPSIAQGPEGEINKAFEVNGWPTHVLIDPNSRLIAYGKWETIKDAVNNRIWEPKTENTDSEAE
ncbi:MAG: TlpA disulfide reductase family protein [Myxococcota bacterium]|nr:TlpA disulfide reductase family protein [Myxococcota bacterium]